MLLYHFTSAKWALDTIRRQRIKVSRFNDLNDPFELYGAALPNKLMRVKFRDWKNHLSDRYGLICFSKSWHNPLLWSHYADRHRGVALVFDVPDDKCSEVSYHPERLVIDFETKLSTTGLDEKDVNALLTTKFEHWKYEEEVRLFADVDNCIVENDLWFAEFNQDLSLKGIVHGPLCQISEKEIASALPSNQKLTIIKSRLAFKKFSVVRNERVKDKTVTAIA